MLTIDTCPICGSQELQKIPANLAPFIRLRCGIEIEPTSLSRCYCASCDFSFFDHRLDKRETLGLYQDYRGVTYRALRERLEPDAVARLVNHEERSNEFHRARIHHTATLLSQWGVQPRKVLDYGGEADAWLARGLFPEAEVQSYDLSTDMPPPPQGVFDLVLCAHVLEHVSFPLPFLKDLERYLAPGGCLYVEVPYDPIGPLADTLLEGHPLNRMHEHISFFTPRSVCRLLAATGMEPTHAGSFASPDRGIVALARKSDAGRASPSTLDVLPALHPSADLYATPLLSHHFACLDRLAQLWLAKGIRAVLYPAGNYSMEILASTRMREAVVALGDRNPCIYGKTLMGKRVYSPEEILDLGVQTLLIASPLHENEIYDQLTSLFGQDLPLLRASQVSNENQPSRPGGLAGKSDRDRVSPQAVKWEAL